MSEEIKNIGTCEFCGQTRVIETLGGIALPQAELDRTATELCKCEGAQAEKRRIERKRKINDYVSKHFRAEQIGAIKTIIESVERQEFEKVRVNLDGKTADFWLDAQIMLHMKVKKVDEDEVTV